MKLIVAADALNGIGRHGRVPWHIPLDLARFKTLTMGGTVIMGRKTWESLPARFRPLPGRYNIVLTRLLDPAWPKVAVVSSLSHIADPPGTDGPCWIIGGGQVYRQAMELDLVDEIYLTRVHGVFDCDVTWPGVPEGWRMTHQETHHNDRIFTFETWVKP